MRLYVEAIGLATFPDVSVICGPLMQHGPSPRSTALNPSILVEVTSTVELPSLATVLRIDEIYRASAIR